MFDLSGLLDSVRITPPNPESGEGTRAGKIRAVVAWIILFAAFNIVTDKIETLALYRIRPQIVIPLLCGFIMGPVEGFIVGFAGNLLGDFFSGGAVKYALSYSVGNGVFGCMMGFYGRRFRSFEDPRALTTFFAYMLLTFSVGVLYSVAAESVLYGTDFLDEMERKGISIVVMNFFAAISLIPPFFYLTGRIIRTIANRFILFLYYFTLALAIGSVAVTLAFLEEEREILETKIPELLFMCNILIIPVFFITFVSFFIAHHITRRVMEPLSKLNSEIIRIANGGFDDRIKVNHEGIIQNLADSFNEMTEKLAVYSEEIARTARDKERMRTELSVAARIQSMLLPSEAENENHDTDVAIYGMMIPEKEVGGDFFNYIFMDGGRLFFVVADVSGHGIPAALFMMVADSLLLG
ncbi:MAG: ECF transporter S component, partial [Synergistaceae bacterium]|nr:ECF transporter S component [Synergistaceae bacterium]